MAMNGAADLSTKKFGKISPILEMPDLAEIQKQSFHWFRTVGIKDLFAEISPIQDFTGKNLEVHFEIKDDPFDEPNYGEADCRGQDRTYQAPLKVTARLHNKQTGEIKEMEVFMGDFPLITSQGTFIYNGAERVVVSQLVRSPGAYFTADTDPATGPEALWRKADPQSGSLARVRYERQEHHQR